jgi:pimeloyl-ACP methyl ester carboxylesterase
LTRSWLAQWPDLPDAMAEAAAYVAPTVEELATLTVPMGLAAAVDDPVHPADVAVEWAAAARHAALRTVTLDEMGADPSRLGAACVAALLEL